MEKEKVLEIEITKINHDWSAITVKTIKKDFENNDFFEWINIGDNYLYDRKIFINRIYPHIPFLIRNEIIEQLEDVVNAVNEKYGTVKRWRAEKGGIYWFIDIDFSGKVRDLWDQRSSDENTRYNLGNYFKTKEIAQKVKEELDKFWEKVRAGEIGG